MREKNSQIFYDSKHYRWRYFKGIVFLVGTFLSFIFGILILSILINPILPTLGLDSIHFLPASKNLFLPRDSRENPELAISPEHTNQLSKQEECFQKTNKKLLKSKQIGKPDIIKFQNQPTKKSEIIAFFVDWDDASFSSLKENISKIDKLMPEWLHLVSADGNIEIDDSQKQAQTLSFIKQYRPNLPIVPLINNFNNQTQAWDSNLVLKMFSSKKSRALNIQKIYNFVHDNGFAGINIDYENISPESQPDLTKFMSELYAKFHPQGLEVSQSFPLNDPSLNYQELAKFNDYLVLMAYDEHWSEGEPGPVASQNWYKDSLDKISSQIPSEKYVIAIGNYGYDWKQNAAGNDLSFQEAVKTAHESEGKIAMDNKSLNPTFDYYDDNNKIHHVWFLDAVTAFNELKEGQKLNPRGFALWRLGSEDPSTWNVIENRNHLDKSVSESLKVLRYGYGIDYQGRGDVLKVTDTPHDGLRDLNFQEPTSLIKDEKLVKYPSPYIITRWGGRNKKKIAITFDDGPDANYTPKILDILRQNHVPATFFVIGMNAENNPALLKRVLDEGNEIGNHTFTHPDISMISEGQLRLELNATERLIESQLGRRTVFFRPPYSEDVEPETLDQVKPLLFTGSLGYYTIGMPIDPQDWLKPGVDKIVKETVKQTVRGDGNIILLHDGGGDRSQTIEALPKIIKKLKSKGYELTTVANLLGLKNEDVMPKVSENEKVMTRIAAGGFLFVSLSSKFIYYVFFLGIILGSLRLLFIGTLAVVESLTHAKKTNRLDFSPSVSVVIPAHNEEKTIRKTINALLNSSYPNFDIIVVDDGSKDKTHNSIKEKYQNNPRVCIYTKANEGKAEALNYGIEKTETDIVITLDADTIFLKDTIRNLVRHFENPKVSVVAGNIKVGNRSNIITKCQALEYITSQNLDRRAFEFLNCITVVPGAVGAWRRKLIIAAGGFTNDTLAEDTDLTLTLLRNGSKIIYDDQAFAYTEAPENVSDFLKQRFRWTYGTLQTAWKHRDTLFRPRYGLLGILALPNIFLFQIIFPLISPLIDLVTFSSLAFVIWQRWQHPNDYSVDLFKHILFYYALFLAMDFLSSVIAFILERKEDWKLLIWTFFQRFFYRQLMYYIAVKSVITAIKGREVSWHKIKRKATVSEIVFDKNIGN